MKKISIICSVVVCLCSCLALSPHFCFADGGWVVTNSYSFTNSGGGVTPYTYQATNGPSQIGISPSGAAGTCTLSGSVLTSLKWQPSEFTPGAPPPTSQQQNITVLVSCWVGGYNPSNWPPAPTCTLNDGFKDTMIPLSFNGWQSIGQHVVTATVSQTGGTWSAVLPSLSISGTAVDPTNTNSGETVRITYTAAVCPFDVVVTGPVTMFKNIVTRGGHQLFDADGDPLWIITTNELDPKGVMWGDIGIPDVTQRKSGDRRGGVTPFTVDPEYTGSINGSWHLEDLLYTWKDGETGAKKPGYNPSDTAGSNPLIEGFPVTYTGAELSPLVPYSPSITNPISVQVSTAPVQKVANPHDTSKVSTVSLTVTDGYGGTNGTQTAYYKMRIHRQYELTKSNCRSSQLFQDLACSTVGLLGPPENGDQSINFAYQFNDWLYADASDALSVLTAVPGLGWGGTAIQVLGITAKDLSPQYGTTSINFDQAWDDNITDRNHTPEFSTFTSLNGTTSTNVPNVRSRADYEVRPKAVGGYLPIWYLIDEFGPGGFMKETKGYVAKFLHVAYIYGVFVQVVESGATQHNVAVH